MGDFGVDGNVQYVEVGCDAKYWTKKARCSVELTYTKSKFIQMNKQYKTADYEGGLRGFNVGLKYGSIRILSSGEYQDDDDVIIKSVDRKVFGRENADNTNNKKKRDDDEEANEVDDIKGLGEDACARCDLSVLAALSPVLYKAVAHAQFGSFAAIEINLRLVDIKNVLFWFFVHVLRPKCNPIAIAAFAHYIDNDELLSDAVKMCILQLSKETVLSTCLLFKRLNLRNDQGLGILAKWIDSRKNSGVIDDELYAEIRRKCSYVENLVAVLTPQRYWPICKD